MSEACNVSVVDSGVLHVMQKLDIMASGLSICQRLAPGAPGAW